MINLNKSQKIYFRRLQKGSKTKLYNSFILEGKTYKVFAPLMYKEKIITNKLFLDDCKKNNWTLHEGEFEKEKFLLTTTDS
tara:strand:+ start:171 stop:413 length:243 start_codon:yes stop_codon:yes gene_type:complete